MARQNGRDDETTATNATQKIKFSMRDNVQQNFVYFCRARKEHE
jgi:hypothetical protein